MVLAPRRLLLTPALERDLPCEINVLGATFAVPAFIVIAATLPVVTVATPSPS